MLIRIPSAECYAAKVEIEQQWLPKLAPHLPLPIPTPLAMGNPGEGYPWKWSIYRWLKGNSAAFSSIENLNNFATCLGQFLNTLQKIDTKGGPLPGIHNFYHGGMLKFYDVETRQAIDLLKEKLELSLIIEIWELALASNWQNESVWVHGDVSAGNLLVQDGKLSAVIDFGSMAIGDPACDLSIAWTLFDQESRQIFRSMLSLDSDTWARGRGWTLWKALIIAAKMVETNAIEGTQSWRIIQDIITDHNINL